MVLDWIFPTYSGEKILTQTSRSIKIAAKIIKLVTISFFIYGILALLVPIKYEYLAIYPTFTNEWMWVAIPFCYFILSAFNITVIVVVILLFGTWDESVQYDEEKAEGVYLDNGVCNNCHGII